MSIELFAGANEASMSSKVVRHNRESMKLARTFFVLFLAFTVCWAPIASVILVDHTSQAPHLVDMFFEILAHFNSSINAFLYGLSNNHFRAGYVKFLHLDRFFSCFKRDENNTESTLKANTWNTQNNNVHCEKKLQGNVSSHLAC